jgi:hypothetical protein
LPSPPQAPGDPPPKYRLRLLREGDLGEVLRMERENFPDPWSPANQKNASR